MDKQQLTRFLLPLRLIFGAGVLALLLWHLDMDAVASLSILQIGGICVLLFAMVGATWFEAARLRALCANSMINAEMMRMVLISYFVTNFTPSSFGGDGYKVFALGKKHGYSGALALVLLERILGLAVLFAGAAVLVMIYGSTWIDKILLNESVALFRSDFLSLLIWLFLGAVFIFLALCVFFRRQIARFLVGFFSAWRKLSPAMLLKNLSYSFCLHLIRALLLCATLVVLGLSLDVSQAWLVLTVAAIASLLPLSPGGLGIREAAMVISLAPFGIDIPNAILVSLVFRLASIAQAAIGASLMTRRAEVVASQT